MSHLLEPVKQAATLDWNLVAAAAATFIGTLIATIWGWVQGKKKLHQKLEGIGEASVTGVAVMDNQTLRELTLVNREVRDQLLLHCHALNANSKAMEDNTSSADDILDELKRLRRDLKEKG